MLVIRKKPKLYLDTNVISFYYAEDAPEKMVITRKFFDQELPGGAYEIYLSALTVQELGRCKDPELQDKLLEFAYALRLKFLIPPKKLTKSASSLL